MPDSIETQTDSQAAATTPAAGTEVQANDQTGATGAEPPVTPQAPPELDDDFLKRLGALDPATLPAEVRQKLETPFKSDYTQKTQTLAEERKRLEAEKHAIFELARKAIAEKPAPTGPTADDVKRQRLLELAAQGDSEAQQQLVQMEVERQIQPVRTQVALQNAATNARAANPYVVKHWGEIIQTMQTDPVIAKLATMDNYAAADRVMIALGLEHQVKELMPQIEAQTKEIESLKTKLARYEQERGAGLPSSTTRAGTTTGKPGLGEPTNEIDAGLKAWLELGYPREAYR